MNLLCKVFGHKPPVYAAKGWWSGEQYARVRNIQFDGIGRAHASVYSTCPRCEEEFLLCRIHLPKKVLKQSI